MHIHNSKTSKILRWIFPLLALVILAGNLKCRSVDESRGTGKDETIELQGYLECGDYKIESTDSSVYLIEKTSLEYSGSSPYNITQYVNVLGAKLDLYQDTLKAMELKLEGIIKYDIVQMEKKLASVSIFMDLSNERFGYLVMNEKQSNYSIFCNDTTLIDDKGDKMLVLATDYTYPIDFDYSYLDTEGNGCLWIGRSDSHRHLRLIFYQGSVLAIHL